MANMYRIIYFTNIIDRNKRLKCITYKLNNFDLNDEYVPTAIVHLRKTV